MNVITRRVELAFVVLLVAIIVTFHVVIVLKVSQSISFVKIQVNNFIKKTIPPAQDPLGHQEDHLYCYF